MKKFLVILFIFTLAFSLRFFYIAKDDTSIEQDEALYDNLGMNLLETASYISSGGQPTALRPPLYAVFLALIYKIFGHSYFAIRIAQAILSAFTACIFFLIAERIFNNTVALMTGIFCSIYMTFIFYTKFLITETLFSFILALIVYFAVTVGRAKSLKMCFLGILCGILTLIRPSGFFMPLIICVALWFKGRGESQFFKKSIIPFFALLISFGLVLLPWTIRNYSIYKRFIPVSTSGGQNIYQAVKPAYGRIPEMGPRDDAVAEIGFSISNEAERSDYFMKKAIETYKENPKGALKSFIIRFLFFWNIIDWNVTSGDIINYHFIFIIPFAFLGIIYSLRTQKDITAISLVIFYFTSLVLVFQGAPRFRMPIDGYIIMMGCYGLYESVERHRQKITPIVFISAYFLFTYLLYRHSLQVKYFIKTLMEKIGLW